MTPKLPALDFKAVTKLLKKKGFVLDRIKGSHHVFRHSGTRKIVVVPYRKAVLPKGTLLEIFRQAGIDREELDSLL
ncbi:MAG: type II toxin-antitoxin system HicA family toxin [Promethearchaeota archaeon]